MTTIESRATWGARASRGSSYLASTNGVKGHYTGGAVSVGTITDHDKCRAAMRGIQNGHMDGNGWNDIGYSGAVCDHDVFMIGRGAHVLPAANGAGLNSGHYAILVLVGTSGVVTMTNNMKRAFRSARTWLQTHGAAGTQIKGHRDGYATSCPGSSVYGWIQDGAPLPGGPTPDPEPPTTEPESENVPQYFSYGRSATMPIEVPAGDGWTKITWDTEYSDPSGEHSGSGYTMLLGDPSLFTMDGFVRWADLPAGAVVEHRVSEYRYQAGPPAVDALEEEGWESTSVLSRDLTSSFSETGSLAEGRKLVLEVRHSAATAAHVVGARSKIDAWQ